MIKTKRNPASLDDILVQAKISNRLMSAQLKSTMTQQELIALLSTTDASPKEIAEILNTTSGTVSTTIDRLKKRASKKVP